MFDEMKMEMMNTVFLIIDNVGPKIAIGALAVSVAGIVVGGKYDGLWHEMVPVAADASATWLWAKWIGKSKQGM